MRRARHHGRAGLRALTLTAALCWAGCGAGDGSGLDERGRSSCHPQAPGLASRYGAVSFDPTYTGVATVFFAEFCVSCHAGSGAARGLDLSPGAAFGALVGVPASQRPQLFLVDKGRPDQSYLVIKLEGGAGMGGRRMPRNKPPRPKDEIDVVREWIASGAPRN